jgi:aspartate dehydrogenase
LIDNIEISTVGRVCAVMEIGLIGSGSIGQTIANAIKGGIIDNTNIRIIADIPGSPNLLKLANEHNAKWTNNVEDFIKYSLDLVIEAASQEAAYSYIPLLMENKFNVMIMSVGSLGNEEFIKKINELAELNGCKVYIPSGAIGGIDIIQAAKVGTIESVTLTTRKPANSLEAAGELLQMSNNNMNSVLEESQVVFEGCAREAIKRYPKNVNVAATISLAGIGFDKTRVKIIADPKIKMNMHEINVKGDFGKVQIIIENNPSPANPKTSSLACLSSIALLQNLKRAIKLGV